MDAIKNLISQEPFVDKLVMGDYKEKTVQILDDFFKSQKDETLRSKKEVAIICKEKDYLFVGKTLKDFLEQFGYTLQVFIAENDCHGLAVAVSDYKIVICIGDTSIHGQCAVIAKNHGFKLVCISTSLVFLDAFYGVYQTGAVEFSEGDVYKYIIDVGIYKKLKRSDLADGYAFSAALSLMSIEVFLCKDKNFGLASDEDYAKFSKYLSIAQKTLLYITQENAVGVITVAQTYIAKALNMVSGFNRFGIICAGRVLASMTGTSLYECVFGLTGPYLTAIKGYLSIDDVILSVPNVNKDVEKLSEILRVSEKDIYDKLSLYDNRAIKAGKEEIKARLAVCDNIDALLKRYKKLLCGYEATYKGRHNRKTFTKEQALTALNLGGLTASGVLKLMYNDGFFTLLTNL